MPRNPDVKGSKARALAVREDIIFMYRTGEHIERIVQRSGYTEGTVKQTIRIYQREVQRGEHAEELEEWPELGGLRLLRPLCEEAGPDPEARPTGAPLDAPTGEPSVAS